MSKTYRFDNKEKPKKREVTKPKYQEERGYKTIYANKNVKSDKPKGSDK